jgi:uncharacterized protein YidB (DUF937 family)
MGLFDEISSALGGGGNGDKAEGAMKIVSGLLGQGGGQGQSSDIVGALLGGSAQGQGGDAGGGMAGVLETLAANGLGEHVSSWLSNNQNLPISPDQIRDALGNQQVEQMANASGLPIGDFLKHLADHLPAAAAQSAGAESA